MRGRWSPVVAAAIAASGVWPVHGAQPIGCIIEPDEVAEVGSPVIGVIQSIPVQRGDAVRKGQIIAVLRNDIERASLELARSRALADAEEKAALASYDFARQRLARAVELHGRQFISKQALDQAEAEARVAEHKLAQAREQQLTLSKESALASARLEERTIRSPIDGFIAERYLAAGERVEEKALVRVAKIDPLRVEVILPSALFGAVSEGAIARIVPEMPGAAPLNAKVTLVDKVLDAPSNTFRVRLLLPNPKATIPAGVRCKAEFPGLAQPAKDQPPRPDSKDRSGAKP
ncbi:MAG: efflux RND transporter periplasmic adaptor subunit [Burkholderiales bacterium]